MRHVVLVRHNSYLFKGTVEENLRMAKPDATEAEMEEVLDKVISWDFCRLRTDCRQNFWKKPATCPADNARGWRLQSVTERLGSIYF